ncbi:hypothetical protein AHAS_Ahas03G0116100 [Arachis hypogaea]
MLVNIEREGQDVRGRPRPKFRRRRHRRVPRCSWLQEIKRDHSEAGSSYDQQGSSSNSVAKGECSSMSIGKAKMWEEDHDPSSGGGGGMDELLVVLGYKVRNSNMASVTQKLETKRRRFNVGEQ